MKGRTARRRKIEAYTRRLLETRPQDNVPPCVMRAYEREESRSAARRRVRDGVVWIIGGPEILAEMLLSLDGDTHLTEDELRDL